MKTIGLGGSFLLAFSYGFLTSLRFWREDRVKLSGGPRRRFVFFLGLPMIAATIAFFEPVAHVSTWLRYSYSAIVIAFLIYLLLASISGILIFLKRKSPRRWLYATSVFGTADLFTAFHLLCYFASR